MGGFIGFKRFRVWWWLLTPQFFKFLKSTSLSSIVHHNLDPNPNPDPDPDPNPNPDPDQGAPYLHLPFSMICL